MKRLLLFISMSVLFVTMFTGCGMYQRVEQGEVGVKVSLYGSKKGVTDVVNPGGYFLGFGQEIYTFPTTQTQYSFTREATEGSPTNEEFRFNVKGGLITTMDIGVTAFVEPSMADVTYKTYRTTMDNIIKKFVRQEIRDQLSAQTSTVSIDDLTNGAMNNIIRKVETNVREKFAKQGIIIVSISSLNDIRYPDEIRQAIIAKTKATQTAIQKENELKQAEAEARIVEAKAKAEAMANEAKKVSLTPELLEYEKIQVEKLKIEAWKSGGAKVPTTVIIGGNEKPNLMLGVPTTGTK